MAEGKFGENSMLDIQTGETDINPDFEKNKTPEEVKKICLEELDQILGKDNYTISEAGDVTPNIVLDPDKESDLLKITQINEIEFRLKGAMNQLKDSE